MSLLDKLRKVGSIKESVVLSESPYFQEKDIIPSEIPSINIAFSGELDGGIMPGLTVIAGPSRHFKSNIGLMTVKAYFQKYDDAFCIFYDSEFGITPEYLRQNGVDPSRVLHVPIEHIEQLKFDISKKLEEIKRGDKVIIFIDSIGNLASKKEVEDALEEKTAADMTRAKQLKSLFRIVTPHLTMKDLPLVVINHTYQTMEMYSKAVISGGTGVMYSCNQAFIIGRSQEKEGSDLVGYNFTINIEKSRSVIEKSKIPLNVTFEGGINRYSGILELALEGNFVAKPSMGWYQLVDTSTGELVGSKIRARDTETEEFLGSVLKNPKFKEFVKRKYKIGVGEQKQQEVGYDE